MQIDVLVYMLLTELKKSKEYKVMPPEEQARLDEILDFVDTGEDLSFLMNEQGSAPTALLQIKVTLKGIKPPIWRRFTLPNDYTFADLHDVIQLVMGWEHSHLYDFDNGEIIIEEVSEEAILGLPSFREKMDAAITPVKDFLSQEGDKITYTYDFGDNWEHVVQLEKILPLEEEEAVPVCLKGRRACPPEDCGGVWGYNEILEELKNGGNKELAEWLGEYDPDEFDLKAVNQRIMSMFL